MMGVAQSKSQLRRFITQSDVTVIDKNTVEIAGIHYRRANLPPEGMVERFVVQPKGTEPGYETEAEARSNADYMFSPAPWRILRIFVPGEAE